LIAIPLPIASLEKTGSLTEVNSTASPARGAARTSSVTCALFAAEAASSGISCASSTAASAAKTSTAFVLP